MTKDPMQYKFMPMTSVASGYGHAVLPDVYCYPVQIVNVSFVGNPNDTDGWVLIDAGMPKSADRIVEEAEQRFGKNTRPKAIILTHGHFDHVGAAVELAEKWQVPVYAHEKELPYLTGKESYPDPDPSVEGGMVAKLSRFFPEEPIDLGGHIHVLPKDGSVPELPGWRWLHTPGHTPGHISLFRDHDRMLLAGDAFVTVKQDQLYKVLTQEKEIQGPPRYFTPDWEASRDSVKRLRALNPAAAITGHGWPVAGEELSNGLQKLADHFDEIAIPDQGRYVKENRKNRGS